MAEKRNVDRRVLRTRQLLRDALMALILERGYDSVTIQDITDRANLGRATFYLHYRDKEELLVTSLKDIYHELSARFAPTPGDPLGVLPGQPSLLAFQHVAENRDLYRVMLKSQGGGSVERQIQKLLADIARRRVTTQFPTAAELPIPVEILAQHVAGSLLALITWWLENDLPYDAQYMAETFQQLNVQALVALFGAKAPTVIDS